MVNAGSVAGPLVIEHLWTASPSRRIWALTNQRSTALCQQVALSADLGRDSALRCFLRRQHASCGPLRTCSYPPEKRSHTFLKCPERQFWLHEFSLFLNTAPNANRFQFHELRTYNTHVSRLRHMPGAEPKRRSKLSSRIFAYRTCGHGTLPCQLE